MESERLSAESRGLLILPAAGEQDRPLKKFSRQNSTIAVRVRIPSQRDRPLRPKIADLPECASLKIVAKGVDRVDQDLIEGAGLLAGDPGRPGSPCRLQDGQRVVETAVDRLVVFRVCPEVARVEEQKPEVRGSVPLGWEGCCA